MLGILAVIAVVLAIWRWSQGAVPVGMSYDEEERRYIKKCIRGKAFDKNFDYTRRYLDQKRKAIGQPRRPGVNAAELAELEKHGGATWQPYPGDE